MKALIAVDGSAGSFEGVSQVARLLDAVNDQVALYYSPPEVRLSSDAGGAELVSRARRALADAVFEEARKRLPPALANAAHTIVDTHDPRNGIPLAAAQWSAELIVMGARGLGLLERLLLGSVSRAVAHSVRIPLLVCRPHPKSAADGMRIVVACDSPENGRPAVEVLAKFTWPPGTTCRTLTVISSLLAGRVPPWLERKARSPDIEAMARNWVREHEEEARAQASRMQEFSRSVPPSVPMGDPLVVEGEPSEQILATISRDKSDLVVIGVKHKHPFAEAIFGSVSSAVLSHAACSVLVIPLAQAG